MPPQQRLSFFFFLLESKIARVAQFLAIDHSGVAALDAHLFMIYSRVKRLGLLQALAAYGSL